MVELEKRATRHGIPHFITRVFVGRSLWTVGGDTAEEPEGHPNKVR
jgi:hypothetical protein